MTTLYTQDNTITTLYKLNNNNRISWWKIEQFDTDYAISWGQDVATINNSTANYNVYKTPSDERAKLEMQSRINEQIERRGYTEGKPKAVPDLPMLAQKWEDHVSKGRQPFPEVCLQPKLDGMRCIGTNAKLTTRRAEEITSCPHIMFILEHLDPDMKLDGELYIPNVDLQTLQSYVRRQRPHKLSELIEYHIFDCVDTEMPFTERIAKVKDTVARLEAIYQELQSTYKSVPEKLRRRTPLTDEFPIKVVHTTYLSVPSNHESIPNTLNEYHQYCVEQGYEGAMVRNAQAEYDLNYRSPNLLKYKKRLDDEFKIIDISEGYNQTAIFVCTTSDDKVFEATPAWTTERKKWLLRNKEKYIGKWVTVEYEKLSLDGIPLKPVGKCTREAKDD